MEINWFPVYLSLKVAALATCGSLLFGVPLGYLLARRRLPLHNLISAITTLPMVLPPTVLGYYLLLVIGRQSPIGRMLESWGITLVFTWQAAVLASLVVSIPLMIRSVQAAFEAVDPTLEAAARTLGRSEMSIFITVTVPLAWRGILAGTVLAFTRALGEFGATLMVAGNIPGRTQTLSVAIYDAVQTGNDFLANALVVLISLISIGILVVLTHVAGGRRW